MTIKSLKGMAAKLLTVGLLAGTVALAVPSKADAQVVVFAGNPHRVYARYDRFRAEEFRRHEEWRRDRFDRRFDRRYDRFYR